MGQGPGSPAQEAVALGIAPYLVLEVGLGGARRCVGLHGQRVVHRHIDGQHRIEHGRIHALFVQGIAHGRDVDQRWRAGGVVHEHAARLEGDLGLAAAVIQPGPQGSHGSVPFLPLHVAQHVLQQQPEHHGQARQALAQHARHIGGVVADSVQFKDAGKGVLGVFHS